MAATNDVEVDVTVAIVNWEDAIDEVKGAHGTAWALLASDEDARKDAFRFPGGKKAKKKRLKGGKKRCVGTLDAVITSRGADEAPSTETVRIVSISGEKRHASFELLEREKMPGFIDEVDETSQALIGLQGGPIAPEATDDGKILTQLKSRFNRMHDFVEKEVASVAEEEKEAKREEMIAKEAHEFLSNSVFASRHEGNEAAWDHGMEMVVFGISNPDQEIEVLKTIRTDPVAPARLKVLKIMDQDSLDRLDSLVAEPGMTKDRFCETLLATFTKEFGHDEGKRYYHDVHGMVLCAVGLEPSSLLQSVRLGDFVSVCAEDNALWQLVKKIREVAETATIVSVAVTWTSTTATLVVQDGVPGEPQVFNKPLCLLCGPGFENKVIQAVNVNARSGSLPPADTENAPAGPSSS